MSDAAITPDYPTRSATLGHWKAALAAVLGSWHEEECLPAPGQGTAKVKIRRHATDPGSRWAASSHIYGNVPTLLDEVPPGASTAKEHHTVPGAMVGGTLAAQAHNAIVRAREMCARAIVPHEPEEKHGVLVLTVTLVLSP